jgi:hypothetical protein
MLNDKIRYLVFLKGRFRWSSSKAMRDAGFRLINLSPGLFVDGRREPSIEDKREALRLNEEWDRYRSGLPPASVAARTYPKGSVGDGYMRVLALRGQARKSNGVEWSHLAFLERDSVLEPLLQAQVLVGVGVLDVRNGLGVSRLDLGPLIFEGLDCIHVEQLFYLRPPGLGGLLSGGLGLALCVNG